MGVKLRSALLIVTAALALGGCGLPQVTPSAGGQGSSPAPSPTAASTASPVPSPTAVSTQPGAASATPTPATPTSGGVSGSATDSSGWTTVVTASAGQLQVAVTVQGPLTVVGGCDPTLTAWAETASGSRVPTPTPSPFAHCLAIAIISVPAGTTRTFSTSIPEPSQPGTYTVVGTIHTMSTAGAAIPAVTITL
ncbi:MAG: hypothetical protein ABSH07_09425 [Candidatus Dormibacteria bacterium]|jgi:hypothetical protein